MIYLWGLLASLCALVIEYTFRSTKVSWVELLPITAVPMVVINYAIFRTLRVADSWLSATVVFAVCNVSMRVVLAVWVLHERPKLGVWIAAGLLLGAAVIRGL